jgi:hypothetical protein
MDPDHPLVDAIIKRCRDVGWSLPDLDAEAGTGSYFRSCCWKKHPPNLAALLKAIHGLGGRLEVTWEDWRRIRRISDLVIFNLTLFLLPKI